MEIFKGDFMVNKTKHCKLCKKVLRKPNKTGVCSNCGGMTYYTLLKKGLIK